MISLLSVRRRAEEFAAAVDGYPADDAAQNQPVPHRELSELVGVVSALRAHQDASPAPEFATALRDRLMTEASLTLAPKTANLVLPVRARGVRERRLVAVASAVVLIGGTASLAAAAQSALPGEALYPIKRGIERAQAGLSVSPAGKGRDLLTQAGDRLDEVEGLLALESGTSSLQVPRTLESFTEQAQEGSNLLLSSYQDTRDPSSVVTVRQFAATGITMLQQLAQTASPDTRDQLTTAAITLSDIDQRATAICGSCAADLPDLQIPKILLVSAEVNRVLRNLDGKTLDNSHPVIADKGAVRKVQQDASTASESTTDDTGVSIPTSPVQPTASATGGSDVGSNPDATVKKVLDGLDDGLSGVVETLLPELPVNNLLP